MNFISLILFGHNSIRTAKIEINTLQYKEYSTG